MAEELTIEELQAKLKESEAEKAKLAEKVDDLASSVEKLTNKNREIIGETKKAKESAEALAIQTAKKDGDIEALEKSWQEKLDKALAEKESIINTQWETIKSDKVDNVALNLASELAVDGSAPTLQKLIKDYITVEMHDGKVVQRILDDEGKPSAMTLDDLKKKIAETKSLAPLIKASSASGGGQAGEKGTGGKNVMKDEDFEKLEPSQKADFVKNGGEII